MDGGESISGYCDGVLGGEIVGWVINHSQAHALESVFVETDCGERLEFKAIVYRQDLVTVLGRYEKFGFAIPLTALPRFEREVRVFDRHGHLIENGVVALANVERRPSPSSCSIFLHIPKTAGTSLTVALQSQFSPGEVCLYYPGAAVGIDWHVAKNLPPRQLNAFKLLIGHASFGVHKLFQSPTKYYTFLREPLARLKSHYQLFRAAKIDPVDKEGKTIFLYRALNEGLTDEFDNLQTRMVAGAGSETVPLGEMSGRIVDTALQNIASSFGFVGLTERIDVDAKKMFERMSLEPVDVGYHNVTSSSLLDQKDEYYTLIDWDKVSENNKYDFELYRAIAAGASAT
jgi:hypothetical protein